MSGRLTEHYACAEIVLLFLTCQGEAGTENSFARQASRACYNTLELLMAFYSHRCVS